MLSFLPSPILGTLTMILFGVNTVCHTSVLYIFVLLKLMIPIKSFRALMSKILISISNSWILINSLILKLTRNVKWEIEGLDDSLNINHSYLVLCNHISWADIFVLQHIFRHKIPFLKFFLKQELIWVPFLGVAWWALDFPFLKRYSKQKLAKRPDLKGKDFETTRQQCEKFKESPVSVMNFLEGTRYTEEKHQQQSSPYEYLLKPKTGGISIVLSNMGSYLKEVVDITVLYPDNQPPITFWDLLAGNIRHIKLHIRRVPLPPNTDGRSYEEDEAFRAEIRAWVNQLWQEKEQILKTLKESHQNESQSAKAP